MSKKTSKKADATVAPEDAPVSENVEGEATPKVKGALRPRRWNYGIVNDARVVRVSSEGEIKFKKDVQKEYDASENNPTVEEFQAKGGTRHGLRLLSRRGFIKIVHADGTTYPIPYEGAEAPAEASAA